MSILCTIRTRIYVLIVTKITDAFEVCPSIRFPATRPGAPETVKAAQKSTF